MIATAPVSAGAVLHAGCGNAPLPDWLDGTETRLDIDARTNPDVHASMTNLGDIGPFDSVFCSHALEHLYPHDVVTALKEFHRVLKPGGVAWIVVPNLEGIEPSWDVVYHTEDGHPITGFHMYYGDPRLIGENPFMAHHSGFVASTMKNALGAAGFAKIETVTHSGYNLVGIGIK